MSLGILASKINVLLTIIRYENDSVILSWFFMLYY